MSKEQDRLNENYSGKKNWLHWGPYVSERQWGAVREDYSESGDAWNYFPQYQATSRVYRWGEDGIAGICDEQQYLCFALAMWNGKDPILKERLFGLSNGEGNHGEDVKELYYHLDNTPTHSYMKYLYKYPQEAYPYNELIDVNKTRAKHEPEYELLDTGIFDNHKYFDVEIEYAKNDTDDILIRINISNRANEAASIHLLPTLWFRNTWKFGLTKERIKMDLQQDKMSIKTQHEKLEDYYFYFEKPDKILFTENKNNKAMLWGSHENHPFRKNAFHKAVINNDYEFIESNISGTKAAPLYVMDIEANNSTTIQLRLSTKKFKTPFSKSFNDCFTKRKKEADTFYNTLQEKNATAEDAQLQRQAIAGLLWSKQFYCYDVATWLTGDKMQPLPPNTRWHGRNVAWQHLKANDIISMPDKWEYPWFAAWDLAFHAIAFAKVDVQFAKQQLLLLFSDNYMSVEGQLPAYEWNFSDVNPPVQAFAALEIYNIEWAQFGKNDVDFLEKIFPLLLKNYNWWLNREDENKNNVFEGGFLGLDNISVFDRSNGLPNGARLDQADGTAWMAMFTLNMLEIALILTKTNKQYEEDCITFFNHFTLIANSLHKIASVWEDDDAYDDGFFYDVLHLADGRSIPVKCRSIAGITPMFATLTLKHEQLVHAPRLKKQIHNYQNENCHFQIVDVASTQSDYLLTLLTKQQLQALLPVLFNEYEMLAPGGIRSVSKVYKRGFKLQIDDISYELKYIAGDSESSMYGGNSNWRGPVWIPLNYVIVRSLETYAIYYKNEITFPFQEKNITIAEAAMELATRLKSIFLPTQQNQRPIHGNYDIYSTKHFKDLILFYEHFHAETSHGIGASHQTGWTALISLL